MVHLNPWELHHFAKEKKITPREFRDLYCDFGGIRLIFNGKANSRGKQACIHYVENFGCSTHSGRPLVCRLYPLGRQIQSEKIDYIFEGNDFPCLTECSDVVNLPQMTVDEYLKGQETIKFEKAQDAYLELMQNLADVAFTILLETGLSESTKTKTLEKWMDLGSQLPDILVAEIGKEWINYLMLPEIDIDDPVLFIETHNDFLQSIAQDKFGSMNSNEEVHKACVVMMASALYLATSIGANPKNLAEHWVETAKNHGAKE
jgi:Fe-S-cluster containining protein